MDNNVGGICHVCSEERRLAWQEHHQHTRIKEGDFVKIRFRINDNDEWMWVEVTGILGINPEDTTEIMLKGELRNDSVFDPETFAYGSGVGFYRSDIADYCEDGDFDNYKPYPFPGHNLLHEQHE